MNRMVQKYRKQVIRAMQCPRKVKKEALQSLDTLLGSFLEETPDADNTAIIQAFGSPDQLANTLCGERPELERKQWKRKRRIKFFIIAALSMGLILFFSYAIALYYAQAPVYIIRETTINDIGSSSDSIEME